MDKRLMKWLIMLSTANSVAYDDMRILEMNRFVTDLIAKDGTVPWTIERIKTKYSSGNDRESALMILGHQLTKKELI